MGNFSRCKIIGDKIMELKMSTRKSSGYIKVALPDEILEKIKGLMFFVEPLPMTGLCLAWDEPEEKKEE